MPDNLSKPWSGRFLDIRGGFDETMTDAEAERGSRITRYAAAHVLSAAQARDMERDSEGVWVDKVSKETDAQLLARLYTGLDNNEVRDRFVSLLMNEGWAGGMYEALRYGFRDRPMPGEIVEVS